ncbi:hypothetical protein [Chromohalobacter sp. HP20-39]|uniref:hypothetical protein n=1 Tax=Chromohalobacter sp. HP20-39 TaxID=3079306 RepID=UPI00294B94A2|nr:hypothetical protein [Chromohalobacter sp. HP20-39]MDV6319596.1 hypothetical protein [Chromohalobacter sp. HP20-39]
MRARCPHCNEGLKTHPDKLDPAPLNEATIVLAQCANPFCGWGGQLKISLERITKSSRLEAATEVADT